ncbi:hypothetical protein [Kitasatospora fiedleri]|nr:hypothetical protein [Kitasatospora fiedleri]
MELDGLPVGFVDSEQLPRRFDRWPQAGTTTGFEILRHSAPSLRQVR